MDSFDRKEKLMRIWLEWRKGPLAKCSPLAREVLFELLWYLDENSGRPSRGHLEGSLAEADGFFSRGATLGEMEKFDQIVEELSNLGFLAFTKGGIAYSPQMLRGEI